MVSIQDHHVVGDGSHLREALSRDFIADTDEDFARLLLRAYNFLRQSGFTHERAQKKIIKVVGDIQHDRSRSTSLIWDAWALGERDCIPKR